MLKAIQVLLLLTVSSIVIYAQQAILGGKAPTCSIPSKLEVPGLPNCSSGIIKNQASLLFTDPMSGGGMDSYQKTITNYVDLNASSDYIDFRCGFITYNGHTGTDCEILNFYQMDEGIPVLAAANGVVAAVHDGEFDRNTSWNYSAIANYVIIMHADTSYSYYWHMRQNTVRVQVGDVVQTGDTLGLVGSSGVSSGPHLHFEVQKGGVVVDPFTGSCQPSPTWWQNQKPYVLDLPFETMDNGLSSFTKTWALISERPPTKTHFSTGDTLYSWLRLRNITAGDTLKWEFYAKGTLVNSLQFANNQTYSSSWWYAYWILPTDINLYGQMQVKVYRNSSLIATQQFQYDQVPNKLPSLPHAAFSVASGRTSSFLMQGTDEDGSIFTYKMSNPPKHGAASFSGGWNKRLIYTPSSGYIGKDTIQIYPVDDNNKSGSPAIFVFEVQSSATDNNINQPYTASLEQNFPNPFNPTTTINYTLIQADHVLLKVYNAMGREVQTLVNEQKPAGKYSVQFNSGVLASGIYFYSLRSGSFRDSKKLILLK